MTNASRNIGRIHLSLSMASILFGLVTKECNFCIQVYFKMRLGTRHISDGLKTVRRL